jgi:hypothetical protein
MKKFLYALAAVALMSTTSCSNEDFPESSSANGDEVTVTFSAGLDAASASRGWTPSDGKTAKSLTVVAYNAGTKTQVGDAQYVEMQEDPSDNKMKASVTMTFIKGRQYDIVFWAQANDAPYEFDAATQTVTINYDNMLANDENCDAFSNCVHLTVDDSSEKEVTLTRPFAKVSVMTTQDDYDKAVNATGENSPMPDYTEFQAYAYRTFDLVSQSATGDALLRTFKANTYLDAGNPNTFNVNSVDYVRICECYLLPLAEQSLVDCQFAFGTATSTADADSGLSAEFSADGNVAMPTIPVAPNYWTVVLGNFFSNDVTFKAVIDPELVNEGKPTTVDAVTPGSAFSFDESGTYTPDGDLTLTSQETVYGTKTIDLTGKTMTMESNNTSILVAKGATLTINGGTITVADSQSAAKRRAASTSAPKICNIYVARGGKLVLDGVTMETPNSAIYVENYVGDTYTAETNVEVKNCQIKAYGEYVITTSEPYSYYVDKTNVSIDNSFVCAPNGTAINFKVPGTLSIKNSKYISVFGPSVGIAGGKHALVARCGTIIADYATFMLQKTLINDANAAELYAQHRGGFTWGVGSEVPVSAVVVGSKDVDNYPYETTATFTDVSLQTNYKYANNTVAFPSFTAAAYGEDYPVKVDFVTTDHSDKKGNTNKCEIQGTFGFHVYEVLTENVTITEDGEAVDSKYIFDKE